jgi:hypothetical protein
MVSVPSVADPQQAIPGAEIILLGVEEPLCLIHAPNESVDPSEIENIVLAEAIFISEFADAKKEFDRRDNGAR